MDVRTIRPKTSQTNGHHRHRWNLRHSCRRNFLLRLNARAAGARCCVARAEPQEREQTWQQPNLKVKFFRRV